MTDAAHSQPAPAQLRARAIKGVFWSYGSYAVQFLIQAVALVVLARELTAQDFGIFALGLMIVGIGEAVFRLSLGPAIVQLENITDAHLDVAWTSNAGFSALSVAIMAAITCLFLGEGDHPWETKCAVLAMLVSTLLTASGSSGLLLLQRHLKTRDMVGIAVIRALLRYGGAIGLTFFLHDVWALIIAFLAGFFVESALSYAIAPRRVRFAWDARIFRELFGFSGWLHLKNFCFWGGRYVDSLAVNAILGIASLGVYNRAFNLASLPTNQAQLLSYRVFSPLFAGARNDPRRLARLVRHALNVTLLTSVPVALLMIFHGASIIHLVLGGKWHAAGGVLGILSCGLLLRSLNDVQSSALRAAGQPRLEFLISGTQVGVTAAALAPAIWWQGLAGAGYALILGNVAAVVLTERMMRTQIGLSLRSHGVTLMGVLFGTAAAWAINALLRGASDFPTSISGQIISATLEITAFFAVQGLVFLPACGGMLETPWRAWQHHRAARRHPPADPVLAAESILSA